MTALALAAVALLLAGPLPWAMARQPVYRRSPRAALVAWQAVTVGAIVAALAAGPAAVAAVLALDLPYRHSGLLGLMGALSGFMLARLLVSAHRIGLRLRRARRQHREVVDIIAHHEDRRTRVLAHPEPTAYCLPGRNERVVLTQGTLDRLPEDQVRAVLAHEAAHLSARHDLLLEFFTVVHETVPAPLRQEAAMREVRMLIEALADRAAVRSVGELSTARALLALAGSRTPEAAMGAGSTTAPMRLRVLADGELHPAVTGLMYAYAALLLGLPIVLAALSLP